jgi:adenine-specific DNA-methyltransferase
MKTTATYQKLRGGYYTPKPIADFLARWAIRSPNDEVLEPSCGDGEILQSVAEVLAKNGATAQQIADQIHGIEIDAEEAEKSRQRLVRIGIDVQPHTVSMGDFFTYAKAQISRNTMLFPDNKANNAFKPRLYDVVIGNPPYIRYQNFLEEHRDVALELAKMQKLHPNKLTNAWVLFLIASSMLLKSHARLAMVIPAELLQVNYASELRQFLSTHFSRLTIITFKQLLFGSVQQEVVLLCVEHNGEQQTGIKVVELQDANDLTAYLPRMNDLHELREMDHSKEKWTRYFLTNDELHLIRSIQDHPKLNRLGEKASIDVGVVTGQNGFFVTREDTINPSGLNGFTRKIVTHSAQLSGLAFSDHDWKRLASEQQPVNLIDLPSEPLSFFNENLQAYIKAGEAKNYHQGYKCRIRNPWYVVPSIWVPDAFMLRQIHLCPRIILNKTDATCTDTIHRVRLFPGVNGKCLVLSCLNSLSFAFSEILGRSYGGGVLELEPREAESLPIIFDGTSNLNFEQLHKLIADSNDMSTILDITDHVLLGQVLGLSEADIKLVRGIWLKLQSRRINRKSRPSRRSSVPKSFGD